MKIMKKKRDILIFNVVLWLKSGQYTVPKIERYFMMKICSFFYGAKLWKKYMVHIAFREQKIKENTLSFILIPNL